MSRDDDPESTSTVRRDPHELATLRRDPPSPVPRAAGVFASNHEIDVAPTPLAELGATRYEVRALLGEGGMGEVRLCRDARIGRDVAM